MLSTGVGAVLPEPYTLALPASSSREPLLREELLLSAAQREFVEPVA